MDIWKLSLTIYFGIYLQNTIVECKLIAHNTFTVTSNIPLGDGKWQAVATCDTEFPHVTYGANEAYMLTRYGVPISNYQDYLAGSYEVTGFDNRWVISEIGYGNGGYALAFSLQFDYDVWLASENPTGDCYQFLGLQEARDFADNASTLVDTPADTFIAWSPLVITNTGDTSSQGLCEFTFPGINFGPRESVILVSFIVPVRYKSDYIGNYLLATNVENTWYIVRNSYGQSESMDYIMTFAFKTSDTDITSARCLLYVSQDDAVAASSALNPVAATTTVTNGVSLTTQTSTVGTTITTSPTASVSPMTIQHTPRTNKTSGAKFRTGRSSYSLEKMEFRMISCNSSTSVYLYEADGMRNKYVQDNNLWKTEKANRLQCGRLCIADDKCVSVFHHEASLECTAHGVVYGNGPAKQGVSYYVVK